MLDNKNEHELRRVNTGTGTEVSRVSRVLSDGSGISGGTGDLGEMGDVVESRAVMARYVDLLSRSDLRGPHHAEDVASTVSGTDVSSDPIESASEL